MTKIISHMHLGIAAVLIICFAALSGCNPIGVKADACPMPEGHNLDSAFTQVRGSLSSKRSECAPYFDAYMGHLLATAEGDPSSDNKRRFSEFLVWASAEGIISKRQAQNMYNRYFNIKFVALQGDYNNCSQACPNRATVMANMAQELADKEQGLLRVSADSQSFYRADRLLKETELVLEATCTACNAQR